MRLIVILFVFCIGCKTPQTITETVYRDSTIVIETPKIITIPADTVYSNSIHIDSIRSMLQSGISPRIIERYTIREDPETKTMVGILIDEMGNLTAICELQERQIEVMEREITRLRSELIKKTIVKRPGFFERMKNALDLIIYTAVFTIILLLVLRR